MNARYEYTEGSSSKFWAVSVKGNVMTTQWGRIGTDGQTKAVDCGSPAKAKAEAAMAAEKKVKKGYRKVGAAKSSKKKPAESKSTAKSSAAKKPAAKKPAAKKPAAKKPAKKKGMDAKSFEREVRKKFKFDKNGYFAGVGDKDTLGFQHPSTNTKYNIRSFCVIPVADTDTHFKAMALLDGDSNEFVHITEPGAYFNRVFWNDHEEGLYSVDCMEDYEDELDMDEYEGLTKDERIEQMPFFEHPIADSLEEFFDGIQAFTRDEFWADDEEEEAPNGDDDEGESDDGSARFEIDGEECWAGLCDAELASESLDVLGWYIDALKDKAILWVDTPWDDLDFEDVATVNPVGLVVFTQPLVFDEPLTLSAHTLLGDSSAQDGCGFVFLAEFRCEALLTLSDTVAVFAGGLVAKKFVCFAAPDATTHVGTRLESDFVVSGGGDGSVTLWPGTEWKVKAMDGYAGGLAEAAEVLSFDAETIEDDSVNSVVSNLAAGRTKIPKSFKFPPRPLRKPESSSKKKVSGSSVLRMSAEELWAFLDARPASEGSRSLFRGSDDYFFSEPDAFALVAPDLKTARAADHAASATVVVVTEPLTTKETLELCSLGEGDEWFGYWFCEPVSCLDLTLNFNGLAVFEGGLNARIVSTAPEDCHLRVEKHLECSVQCGSVYVADYTKVEIGAVTGWFGGSAKVEQALPSLADEIEDEGSVWQVMLEHFDDLPKLKLPPVAKAKTAPKRTGAKPKKQVATKEAAAKKASTKKMDLAGKTFCVTGTFSEKRSVLHARIEAAGGEVHASVRASTDYLVAGDKTGAAKLAAAAKHGVEVLDAATFDALF